MASLAFRSATLLSIGRQLRRRPGWTAAVCGVLGLGIGCSTALFSLVDHVLWQPLPFPEPDRLVQVWEQQTREGSELSRVSPRTFLDWRAVDEVFAGLAAVSEDGLVLEREGVARRVAVRAVTPGFFALLGRDLQLGRGFTEREAAPGAEPVTVVSDGFWRREMQADPGVLGRRIRFRERTVTVVGVLPPDFDVYEPAEVWVPLVFDPELITEAGRGARYVRVFGRLAEGVGPERAELGLTELHRRLEDSAPLLHGWVVRVVPLREQLAASARPALLLLLGAASLLLTMGCVNAAHLLLARSLVRRREQVIRQALGAGPRQLVQMVFGESLVLALASGALGTLMAAWLVEVLVTSIPWSIPRLAEATVDLRSLGFAIAVSLVTGILAGCVPAWTVSRTVPASALRAAGGGAQKTRWQQGLVLLEVALGLVLLASGGLLVQTVNALHAQDPGFEVQGAQGFFLSLGEPYEEKERRRQFATELVDRLERLAPTAAVGTNRPLSGSRMTFGFSVPGEAVSGDRVGADQPFAQYHAVSPEYFRALAIPLVAGRAFTPEDTAEAAPVAIVSRLLAERYFDGGAALGKHLETNGERRQVVGVVEGVRHFGLDAGLAPEIYVPYAQDPWQFFHVVVRPEAGRSIPPSQLRAAVAAVDPSLPVDALGELEAEIDRSLAPRRFQALLVTVFASLALVLMASGLYSVIAFAASQRELEVGIRMAVGAHRGDILRWLLTQGLRLTFGGIALGVAVLWLLRPILETHLFGVGPTDPWVLGTVAALVAGVALAASLGPALRAARLDPAVLLRRI